MFKWLRQMWIDWRFKRGVKRVAEIYFRETPIQRYLREKYGSTEDSKK